MGETTQEVEPLFSERERMEITRSFIDAYLRGAVKITFWTMNSINIGTGETTSPEMRLKTKQGMTQLMNVASEAQLVSAAATKQAIDDLFKWIILLRTGGFIEGQFLNTAKLEDRLESFEQRMATMERLFEELLQRLKVKGPPKVSPSRLA